MNQLQYLLTKLAEEAAEVAQIALKTSQFGPDEKMPGQLLTNFERIHLELNDLLAVVDCLNKFHSFGFDPDPVAMFNKQLKIGKYRQYSIELGLVDPK